MIGNELSIQSPYCFFSWFDRRHRPCDSSWKRSARATVNWPRRPHPLCCTRWPMGPWLRRAWCPRRRSCSPASASPPDPRRPPWKRSSNKCCSSNTATPAATPRPAHRPIWTTPGGGTSGVSKKVTHWTSRRVTGRMGRWTTRRTIRSGTGVTGDDWPTRLFIFSIFFLHLSAHLL